MKIDIKTIAKIAIESLNAHGSDAGLFLLVRTSGQDENNELVYEIRKRHSAGDDITLFAFDKPRFSEIASKFKEDGTFSCNPPVVLLITNFDKIPGIEQRDFAHLVDNNEATYLKGYALRGKSIVIGISSGEGHIEPGTMNRALCYSTVGSCEVLFG